MNRLSTEALLHNSWKDPCKFQPIAVLSADRRCVTHHRKTLSWLEPRSGLNTSLIYVQIHKRERNIHCIKR
jgi:hypothetical protein